jgi:hypothetical protein
VTLLAQSKLDELAAVREPLPKTASGVFPGETVHWSIETSELPNSGADPARSHLQNVRLILSWQQGLIPRSLGIETRHFGTDRQ